MEFPSDGPFVVAETDIHRSLSKAHLSWCSKFVLYINAENIFWIMLQEIVDAGHTEETLNLI